MTTPSSPRYSRRAFTLIESMATIVVLATMGSVASFLILDAVDGYTSAGNSAQLHAELSIAMDRAVRELRSIPVDAGAPAAGSPDITSVTTSAIDWEDTGGDAYQLSYDSGAKQLTLAIDGGGPAILLSDVTACTISTYDEDNTPLAASLSGDACDPIRRVQIVVTLQRGGVSESLRVRTYIRSTMSLGGA